MKHCDKMCIPLLFINNTIKLQGIQGNNYDSWNMTCLGYSMFCIHGLLYGMILSLILQANTLETTSLMYVCSQCHLGIHGGLVREDMRNYVKLNDYCNDCCIHIFCGPCAIVEESIALDRYINDSYTQLSPPGTITID